jgi:hypothetical protein
MTRLYRIRGISTDSRSADAKGESLSREANDDDDEGHKADGPGRRHGGRWRCAMKVRGGMFCKQCDKPVAAQKSTHRMRNVASTAALGLTMGASALGYKGGQWHCPTCGGPVTTLPRQPGWHNLVQRDPNYQGNEQRAKAWAWFKGQPTWAKVAEGGTLLLLLAIT